VAILRAKTDFMAMDNDNLRIGLLAWWTASNPMSSLWFLAQSLIREWSRSHPDQLVVFYNSSAEKVISKTDGPGNFTRRGLKRLEDVCLYRDEVDVLYTPYWWSEMDIEGLPQVHFIPDLTYAFYPDHQGSLYIKHFILACNHAIGISKYIVTPSEFSKNTLMERLGCPEERIRVIPHGVHSIFLDEQNTGIRPNRLPQEATDYLLYPANPLKRKNHKALLDALVVLRDRYAFHPRCVLTGQQTPGAFETDVQSEILKRGLSGSVHHLGVVSLPELKYLYLNAKALVFPSLFEGFGIPVLEAMTVGCPVIASNRTSIPEVAGGAALYFNPEDPSDLADSVFRFFQDPGLAENLIPAGKKRAADFSDARQAVETRAVLRDACLAADAELSRHRARIPEILGSPPVLTLIVLLRQAVHPDILQGIEKLAQEFGQGIEVIWIASTPAQGLPALAKQIPYQNDFRRTLGDAIREASGSFVFFSRGDVLPLSSLVYKLTDHEAIARLNCDFLYGEAYFRDGRTGAIRSPVHFYSIGEDRERAYCAHYLPFVVRREASVKALSDNETPPKSLSGLAAVLFDTCSRKRMFVPVAAKIASLRPRETPYATILLARLRRELPFSKALFPIMNHRAARKVTLRVLDAWANAPVSVRNVCKSLLKPIWNPEKE
jgi:glycosyltransferase involved in cell wall biosynthesis